MTTSRVIPAGRRKVGAVLRPAPQEPATTGKAVDLSPLMVPIALSFWGLCWGLVGMVLAVPLTAMLKIVFQSVPSTQPIARLMGLNEPGGTGRIASGGLIT